MSYRERMRLVASESELRSLMEDLLLHGSPNWTWESARHFVPPSLHEELSRYFGEDGTPRWPDEDGVETEGSVESISVSAIIDAFHESLAVARQAASERPRATLVDLLVEGVQEDATKPTGALVAEPGILGDEAADEEPRLPAEVCPICERPQLESLVDFRGTGMCAPCIAFLQGRA